MKKFWFIVGSLTVPYVLAPFLWTKRRFSILGRVLYSLWAAVAVIAVIAGLVSPSSNSNSGGAQTKTVMSTNTQSPPAKPVKTHKLTEVQQLQAAVKQSLGQQYISCDVNTYMGNDKAYQGGYMLDVKLNAEDGFNTNQSMKLTLMDVQQACKAVFTQYKRIYEVDYTVEAQLTDKYGNTTTGDWCRMTMMGSDGYKTNYDALDPSQFAHLIQFSGWTLDSRSAWNALLAQG